VLSAGTGERVLTSARENSAWRRATQWELRILAAYFLAIVLVADVLNIRPGVEVMTVGVLGAATGISRAGTRFLRDWWFLLTGLFLWTLSGPIAAASPFAAHLDLMLNIDRFIGLGHQPVYVIQHRFANPGHVTFLDILAASSYNMHLPEPFIVGYILWRLDRGVYLQFAAGVLILLILGLITFIFFPAVPPWMASSTFHRIPSVYNGFGPVLHAHPLAFHGTPLFYLFHFRGDAVAAFPSEHAALPMLEFLAFAQLRSKWAWIFALWTVWILFVVLYLGEHWITDVLAGWAYALVIFTGLNGLLYRTFRPVLFDRKSPFVAHGPQLQAHKQ